MFTAFTCQTDGTINTLIKDDHDLDPKPQPGKNWLDMVHPESSSAAKHFLDEILSTSSSTADLYLKHSSGAGLFNSFGFIKEDIVFIIANRKSPSQNSIRTSANSLVAANNEQQSVETLPVLQRLEDLSRLNKEFLKLQRKLQLSKRDLEYKQKTIERVFLTSPDILTVTNLETGEIVLQNRELDMLRSSKTDKRPLVLAPEIHPDERAKVENYLNKLTTLSDGEIAEIEYRMLDSRKNWQWYFRRDAVISFNRDGSVQEILSLFQDITEKQIARQKLYQMSTHDSLTSLYNRVYFDLELERLQDSRQYPISIFMADVDGLKSINDAFGHSAGDRLIKRAAEVLRKSFRNEDVVARVGGDEFGIILARTPDEAIPNILARINKFLNEFNTDLSESEIHLSIGYSTAEKGDQLDQVLREADIEMYAQKTERKLNGI